MAKQLSFTELSDSLTKLDDLGSKMSVNTFSEITEHVGLGNYLLNAATSGSLFGGIPNGRSISLGGDPGTGKTFFYLNVAREAQKMGYHIFWADSESAVDKQTFLNFGIDPEGVHYQPVKTIKQFATIVSNMCLMVKEKMKKGWEVPKMMVVLDSIGNLSSGKERQDIVEGNDKRDMTKQQELAGMFRVLTVDLAEIKAIFCITNHIYSGIGGYIPTSHLKGGMASVYNSSIIFLLNKSNLKSEDKETVGQAEKIGMSKTGIVISVKPYKNRFAKPIPIKIHLSFFKGMNPYVGLESFISWDICGIQQGTYEEIIREEAVIDDNGNQVIYRGKPKFEKINTGEFEFVADSKSKYWAVKHLKGVVGADKFFTPEVFTDEVLKMLDEKIIRPSFELPKLLDGTAELEEYFSDEDDSNDALVADIFKNASMDVPE